MRHIDLMTYYQPQPCVGDVEPFIRIRNVKWNKDRHLTTTKGNVNFTDLWFAMSESSWELEGKYSSQQISLLGDEESNWEKENGSFVLVALIKMKSKVNQEDVCARIKEEVQRCKIFYTLDNADRVFFGFAKTRKKLNKIKKVLVNYRKDGESVYDSLYMATGKFCMSKSVGEVKNIKVLPKKGCICSCKTEETVNVWCKNLRFDLKLKMEECIRSRNKKWNSYYQSLYQIINLLEQYEQYDYNNQKEKYKDLFYVLFPAFHLFLKQLQEGQLLTQKKLGDEDELMEEKYGRLQKIEKSVSDFIDNLELLIHHIGISCINILNLNGRNGLAYDVPMCLSLMYISALYEITNILNDKSYKYCFLLLPVAYARPQTRVFDLGLEPEDRVLQIFVARHQMYSPRALFAILAHECGHYTNEEARLRVKRAEIFIKISTIALLSELLPDEKLKEELKKTMVDEEAKSLLQRDWKERKRRLFGFCVDKIGSVVSRVNGSREHKYYFENLLGDVREAISNHILCDSQGEIENQMNRYISEMNQYLFLSGNESVVEILGKESEWLEEGIKRVLVTSGVFESLGQMKNSLKELFADCVSIQVLDLDAVGYLELFLLSESYDLDENIITNSLLNRVALVHKVMQEDKEKGKRWKKSWRNVKTKSGDGNVFLFHLKQKVDAYLKEVDALSNKKNVSINESIQVESEEGQKKFDIFLILQVIQYELEYLREANKRIKECVNRNEVEESRNKLRNVFECFKVYSIGKDPSYEELFKRLDIMIGDYKCNVIQMLKTAKEEGLAKKDKKNNGKQEMPVDEANKM